MSRPVALNGLTPSYSCWFIQVADVKRFVGKLQDVAEAARQGAANTDGLDPQDLQVDVELEGEGMVFYVNHDGYNGQPDHNEVGAKEKVYFFPCENIYTAAIFLLSTKNDLYTQNACTKSTQGE